MKENHFQLPGLYACQSGQTGADMHGKKGRFCLEIVLTDIVESRIGIYINESK